MSQVPDAWEDEWSTVADAPAPSSSTEQPKKISSKVTKAQKRAQQAEFNRQLWAEAEGPKQTNFFLESRNVVPLRQEYKPPPILLSRKGPIVQAQRPPPSSATATAVNPAGITEGISILKTRDESSEDEDEVKARELSLAERQARATKDREEKQRKYEERRLELFGPQSNNSAAAAASVVQNNFFGGSASKSGNSSPGSGTPPHSRSSTPSRGGKRGRGRGVNHLGNSQQRGQQVQQTKELYDASYAAKPDSLYLQRREQGSVTPRQDDVQPIRAPKGPDGTAGFNFADRSRTTDATTTVPSLETS